MKSLHYSFSLFLTAACILFSAYNSVDAQGTINCDQNAYLFQYNDIYAIDLTSGNAQLVASDVTPGNINGVGYNPADGNFWGALSSPDKAIVKIGSDVETYVINELPSSNAYIGDINASGIYYLKPGGVTYYKIDLNPSSGTYRQFLGAGTLSQNIKIHDWAFNPVDNQLYAVEKGTNQLYRIDPGTGAVASLGEVSILSGLNYTYGAVYFDVAGNFYVSANQTGTIYIINDVESGGANSNIFSYGPASASNDGARCPFAAVPQEDCSNGIDDDGDGLVDCDDPSCSGVSNCSVAATSGGNEGGLESNKRLSELIRWRNYNRTKENIRFDRSQAKPFRRMERDGTLTVAGRSMDIPLQELIPENILNGAAAVESSPSDLAGITNATDVFSVDYFKDELRVGALLAIKTENKVYEHSKYICDRLLGAELVSVSPIEIEGQSFIKSIIRRPDGETEFVVSFSARVEEESFIIESHWNIDRYTPQNGYYNFQAWSNSLDGLYELGHEVLRLLQQYYPVTEYQCSPPPTAFVRKASYRQGKLLLDIMNLSDSGPARLEGGFRTTETSEEQPFSASLSLEPGHNQATLEAGTLFDAGLRLATAENQTPDDLFISDGVWGLDDSGQGTEVEAFEVALPAEPYMGEGFPVERDIYLKGKTEDYLAAYRTLTPRFTAVDLSSYNTLSFQASGAGLLEVTLVKAGIGQWEEQYRATVLLGEEPKTYELQDYQFYSSQSGRISLSDLKMIVFTLPAGQGGAVEKELVLSGLAFSHHPYSFHTSAEEPGSSFVFPNPVVEDAHVYFSAEYFGNYEMSIVDQRGVVVQRLNGRANPGMNRIGFDGSGLVGGIYFYSIITDRYEPFSGKFYVR